MNKEHLAIIDQFISRHKKVLDAALNAIVDQDVSKYPIMVLHPGSANFGIPIINQEQNEGHWVLNLSSLEEFATKQIINMEKVDDFIQLYKSHPNQYCFFFIHELDGKFIFISHK